MEDFFINQLKNLKVKTGFNQFEQMRTEEEMRLLVDVLVRTCSRFRLIPDERKQAIINTQVINDSDFKGFNAKIVAKWLMNEYDTHRKHYEQISNDMLDDSEEVKAREEFYKKQLEEKRKKDPDYSPSKELLSKLPKAPEKIEGNSLGQRVARAMGLAR